MEHDFKKEIAELIYKKAKITKETVASLLETPKNSEMGDYALPCFTLAKALKMPPKDIAQELSKIKPKQPIEKLEAVGPYLNFFIEKEVLIKDTLSNIKKDYGF